ncbi:thiolase domain-containing protein [Actinocorallia sp. API 0066]|uniref:thiolase domain-containing protein n=1 Tax=Actinocorallia sp. API 0066 TaxID=2896846 RepID=UPI001E457FB7|nr:thiolase domain-containing protein [Actinocorallia sp. API 0066]MCD0451262.1 thiolase domain-containing protein [Actinocorallia sp. API 0066]
MKDIAIVAFAQTRHSAEDTGLAETEMLLPLISGVKEQVGISRFGFTCSGSNDYLQGAPFSFVSALDAVGAWPPISESHVEMDGAWALYEAWVKMQYSDEVDTALVYGFGKPSQGSLREIMSRGYDPYYLAPLGVDSVSMAALQARAYLTRSGAKEGDLTAVAARSRAAGRNNPYALHLDEPSPDAPYDVAPLRAHDVAPEADGAAVVVLATGDRVAEISARTGLKPAWIRGIDHRADPHSPGVRDLSVSPSARLAGAKAGATGVEVAELHVQFSHEELILREALDLGDDVLVNPSGGPLSANPVMAAGLVRIGEAAARIHRGENRRTLGHATSGPCLQQNLVAVLEG